MSPPRTPTRPHTHLVAGLDRAAHDAPKGVKGGAVGLGEQLADVDDQGAARVAGAHVRRQLAVLGACGGREGSEGHVCVSCGYGRRICPAPCTPCTPLHPAFAHTPSAHPPTHPQHPPPATTPTCVAALHLGRGGGPRGRHVPHQHVDQAARAAKDLGARLLEQRLDVGAVGGGAEVHAKLVHHAAHAAVVLAQHLALAMAVAGRGKGRCWRTGSERVCVCGGGETCVEQSSRADAVASLLAPSTFCPPPPLTHTHQHTPGRRFCRAARG